ncbi:GNAT family N-acetyltransferase [sulfur-oxidizing endosymbiont of Gigantopelta aegis]|uniref:GNAT family N-acetyltransferase n=1 Tax=sulfur-oxidizing endosymbiont of Gigantopelta aegis TaxID=2794934 RepID=UPI0018DC6FCD|nr:GNAT family N-acetyltransferase [sulfur-oxidizing endosymbiont of Gigantopelta aegis]
MTSSQLQPPISITPVNWQSHQEQLQHIRETVFIQEQKVPVKLEWDGLDEQALHIIAIEENNQQAIGSARILFTDSHAHIGRMAVLSDWRGQGIGSQILQCCIEQCRKKQVQKIILNAQVYVMEFYTQADFKITSDEFLDAGIAHREMTLALNI